MIGEGIKDEGGDPFEWAVRTLMVNQLGECEEFIRTSCEEEGYPMPDYAAAEAEARRRLKEDC